MSKHLTLELTNNQALHLWGMMATYSHDTHNELIAQGVFKKDGTMNKHRTHLNDVTREKIDNLRLSKLIGKELEQAVNFSEVGND